MSVLNGPLLLPADVLLVPVAELAAGDRQQLLHGQEGDVAVTRPRLRTTSRLVDAAAADLLREFASPSTVVEAVLRHSRARGADPEATLEGAYPLLARLVREGFLVAADGAGAGSIEASWAEGERIAGCRVLSRVQVLEDSEVYQVRSGSPPVEAALKIERLPSGWPDGGAAFGVAGTAMASRLEREAAILAFLAGGARGRRGGSSAAAPVAGAAPITPRLLGAGAWGGRRFLLLEWCSGVDALAAAAEARDLSGERGRAAVLALCRSVAAAYARLHRLGVLHCDVHPRNVLVGAGGEVRLIDFGLAAWRGAPTGLAPAGRGGVAFFFEPEYARAALAGEAPPAASPAGEQYAVAALLYALAAGAHYLDFSLERESMLRQIAGQGPLPFAARGAAAWPELEAVLGRALAKSPADRFPSLDDLAAALAAIRDGEGRGKGGGEEAAGVAAAAAPRPAAPPPVATLSLTAALRRGRPSEELLAATLDRLRPGGPVWEQGLPQPPLASVQYGAAGIALGFYRIAQARDDARLLADADLWSARASALAAAEAAGGSGFYSPLLDITPATVGRASLLHGPPGVHCTEALIANARDDRAGAARAADAFVRAARRRCPGRDLALGRSGLLLGCALLLDALGPAEAPPAGSGGAAPAASPPLPSPAPAAGLRALGDELLDGIWRELAPLPPIGECRELPNLGMAHGWAGYVYAALRWCRATGRAVPAAVAARLADLAAAAESWGRGARWRWHGQPSAESHRHTAPGPASWMAGWCNGSAGMVHLWTLASRLSASDLPAAAGAGRCRQLAVAAGWHAWEAGERVESLCCGLAGRAYALLDLHQRGAGPEWLDRAHRLADRAAAAAAAAMGAADRDADAAFPHSLYRGQLGIAVLAADLERPAGGAMPIFGDEGWTSH